MASVEKRKLSTIITRLEQGKKLVAYCRGCQQHLSVADGLQHVCKVVVHPAMAFHK